MVSEDASVCVHVNMIELVPIEEYSRSSRVKEQSVGLYSGSQRVRDRIGVRKAKRRKQAQSSRGEEQRANTRRKLEREKGRKKRRPLENSDGYR